MLIVWAFELLSLSALLYLFATQLIIPLWQQRPVFPMFSSKEKQIRHALEDANEEVLTAALEKKVQEKKRVAERTRAEINRPNQRRQHNG